MDWNEQYVWDKWWVRYRTTAQVLERPGLYFCVPSYWLRQAMQHLKTCLSVPSFLKWGNIIIGFLRISYRNADYDFSVENDLEIYNPCLSLLPSLNLHPSLLGNGKSQFLCRLLMNLWRNQCQKWLWNGKVYNREGQLIFIRKMIVLKVIKISKVHLCGCLWGISRNN